VTAILDERGKSLNQRQFRGSTADLADRESAGGRVHYRWRGRTGPDPAGQKSVTLAFGAATWPHQLVRIMLLEQITVPLPYWQDHPYHRA